MITRILNSCLGLTILIGSVGCSSFQDHIDGHFQSHYVNKQAKACFYEMEECYDHVPNYYDFRKGFIEGYINVANGGNGCSPMFPPREYWKSYCSTGDMQCRAVSWFDGFAHGAVAAETCGAKSQGFIGLSPHYNGGVPPGAEHHVHYGDNDLDSYKPIPDDLRPGY